MTTRFPHFDLTGRTAVVVHGHTPPGVAIARAYADAGASVTTLVPEGYDVSSQLDEGIIQRTADDIEGAIGEVANLDLVACCPDQFLAKPIGETSDADLVLVMDANFRSHFQAVRAASMRITSPANIILITHVLGERGLANCAAYAAAQGATTNFIRAAAQELGPRRITINGISLGWMDWMTDRLDPTAEETGRAIRFTIAKRLGRPNEIGPMALWLSGTGAGFVTGQIFALDGGLLQHL